MIREVDLGGIGVLVTRPAEQAVGLCRLIERAGGRPIRFPVVEILDSPDVDALIKVADRLEDYDIAVFISANAVAKAMNIILGRRELPCGLLIAAIGRGTARALDRLGAPAQVCPSGRFDSESLLLEPGLTDVTGKRIAIFRGDGGREMLGDTLRARGARVEYVESYRRVRPDSDTAGLMRVWARGDIAVVTITSGQALRNLFDMVGGLGQQWLRSTPIVVFGERTQKLAMEMGVKQPPIVAREASDEAIVDALESWRRATLG